MTMTLPVPPVAEREPKITPIHGTELRDDYAWMREKGAARVTAYLEAENAYTAAAMSGTEALQKTLYDEILSHIKEDDVSLPYRDGDVGVSDADGEGQAVCAILPAAGGEG